MKYCTELTTIAPSLEIAAVSLPSCIEALNKHPDYWIGDTGATTHLTFSLDGMTNLRQPDQSTSIVMGNGANVQKEQKGDLIGTNHDQDNAPVFQVRMEDVIISEGASYNLFSITAMLRKGWKLSGSDQHLILKKDECVLNFDIKIYTTRGMLFCIKIDRNTNTDLIANVTEQTRCRTDGKSTYVEPTVSARWRAHKIIL